MKQELISRQSLYRHMDVYCETACSYPEYRENGAMCGSCGFGDAYNYIESEPTIEAIPVEWINRYIADDTNGWKREMKPIRRMLEAWRAENETGHLQRQ